MLIIFAFGSDAMGYCVKAGPMYSMPFDGVHILVHKKLAAYATGIASCDS
jgi:hypothetical protein